MFTGVLSLSPPRSPPSHFPGVQLNSLPTYRRALLSERLEQAIEKSCPLQMMTVRKGRVFLVFVYIENPLSPPPPNHHPLKFRGKEVNKTAALLSLSSLPSPLSLYCKTLFGGSGREIIC